MAGTGPPFDFCSPHSESVARRNRVNPALTGMVLPDASIKAARRIHQNKTTVPIVRLR